ncbi:MAG: G5 domain-containing protein, partial [Jatrophihabitans sp.]|uniref:aggregation-promoting factor C-terminal-like domain-containing protein n=1 Tax=Jatrophihabitans sp. TaxID=1932789 RepID=UPI003F7D925D
TVVHDGQQQQVTTTALTVAQLFDQLGVTVHADDRVTPALATEVRPGSTIRLVRIENRQVSKVRTVAPPVKRITDSRLSVGRTVVVQPGHAGSERVTWTAVYINGRLSAREKPAVTTLQPAGTRVLRVGTGVPAEATPAQAQAYARSLLPSYGWGDDQMSCLITMWNHESGWNLHAENPSGAYGIPQALPGDKMGPGWDSDAGVQIRWGLGYIKSRYGSPCAAWSFWQQGSWY